MHFLSPSGERHVAEAQRIEGVGEFEIGELRVRTVLEVEPPDGGDWSPLSLRRVSFRVENRTEVPDGLGRGGGAALFADLDAPASCAWTAAASSPSSTPRARA